jgi:hypothetical protein
MVSKTFIPGGGWFSYYPLEEQKFLMPTRRLQLMYPSPEITLYLLY